MRWAIPATMFKGEVSEVTLAVGQRGAAEAQAAQASLARSMALELAPHGIRVNAIAPGDILTDTSAGIVADLKTLGATGKYVRDTPLGRRGSPEDIGNAVAFLVSDEARFITGAVLRVDGGFLTY